MLLISIYSGNSLDRSGVFGYFKRIDNHLWIFPNKISIIERMGENPLDPTDAIKAELFKVTQEDAIKYIVDAFTLEKIFDAQNNRYK